MYLGPANIPLQQGDIIRPIPCPLLHDTTDNIAVFNTKNQSKTPDSVVSTPPPAEMCDNGRRIVFGVEAQVRHVIVLSQSCDLEDISRGDQNRMPFPGSWTSPIVQTRPQALGGMTD